MNERTNTANIANLKPEDSRELEPAPVAQMTGGEIAVASNAATAKALVEARYVIALRQPRIMAKVRQDIMDECRRPGFAHNKSTYYVKPIGEGVEGLGIRFVEAALRCMRNVLIQSAMQYEDDQKEVHKVTVTDLESNVPYEQDLRVSKLVERSKPMDDGSFISRRKNSWGKWTYTVIGTEDEILNKRQAQMSKLIRTLGLRIIPGDIQDEAESVIKKIRLDKAAEDPSAEQKRIVDAFRELNVPADQLIGFIGHPIETCSPAELVKLRGIYGAIRDGEATWAAVVENKAEAPKAAKEPSPPAGTPPPEGQAEGKATATAAVEGTVVSAQGDAHPPAARKRRPAASME